MNDIFPKKTLRKLKAYRPAVSESKDKDVIRLSVNEGALGSSPLATKAIEEWSTKKHIFHKNALGFLASDRRLSYIFP